MKHAIRTLITMAFLAAAPSTAFAQEAATVTCKDGSTSKAGKGACSHHGGVAKAAPSAPSAVPPAPPRNINATPPAAAQRPAPAPSQGRSTPPPAATGKPTAQCKDGTTSYSAHHSGACSHHGGVKQWLDGS
jgi:hypothetical protein